MEQSFHHHMVGSRHNIVFKKEHGEKQAADLQAALDWKADVLPEILQSFKKEDIFNADETGLNYRGYADRGRCLKEDELSGGKKAKDRISVLFCVNVTGTEKCKLLVISKSKHPQCFPREVSTLPVPYESNKNAWMTSDIFRKKLLSWD